MSTADAKRTIFFIAIIGNFIAVLDSASVNLALYPISQSFGTSIAQAQWVIVTYMVVMTAFLPVFGQLGDRFPKNKVFSFGFLMFAVGAVLNTLAPTLPALIASRCVQAIGTAAMISNAVALIAAIFHDKNRGRAIGINSTAIALGAVAGPVLGGFLLQFFGWKTIFMPSAALALAAAYFAYNLLPSGLPRRKKNAPRKRELLKNRTFVLGSLAAAASYACVFTNSVLMPVFLLGLKGFSPIIAGLLVLPFSVTASLIAPFTGNFAGTHGAKDIARIGAVVLILAFMICLTFDENSRIPLILITSALIGLGNGLFQAPSNTVIITSVKRSQLGLASGTLSLARNCGNIFGVSCAVTIFSRLRGIFNAAGADDSAAFLQAYHLAMGFGILFGVVCLTLTYFAYHDRRTTPA